MYLLSKLMAFFICQKQPQHYKYSKPTAYKDKLKLIFMYEEDLNICISTMKDQITALKIDVASIKTSQKILMFLLGSNLLGIGIIGVLTVVLHL